MRSEPDFRAALWLLPPYEIPEGIYNLNLKPTGIN